ncbi:hypothetical protein HIM_01370 [Hirsutella minnesotensis 3608]|nr:hypothetical protein HIM_01370 [Hirsutella minnesotensis 3608]
MSIFSHIRKSRQQAKEHSAKLAEQEKKEQVKAPYKHVPTHAASDAFASAPPSWREVDRPRILEENRRRSAMAASGHHMNMPGVPRVGSSLSHVTYPGEDAPPVARLPKTGSYTSMSPWMDRHRDVAYPVPHISYSRPASLKGKEIAGRWPAHDIQRPSPTPSRGEPSPVESSGGSSGSASQDELEMKPYRTEVRPAEHVHRLHPSRPRRTSDPSTDRVAVMRTPNRPRPSNYARDHRPPPSMRGFASIAQVAAPTPVRPGFLTPPLSSHVGPSGQSSGYTASPSVDSLTPRQNSASSLPALTSGSSRPTASTPATPRTFASTQGEHSIWASIPPIDLQTSWSADKSKSAISQSGRITGEERSRRAMSASDLEFIGPADVEVPFKDSFRVERGRNEPSVAHEGIVNILPEPISIPDTAASMDGKKNKSSKVGGRLLKKRRWSLSKAPAVVV